MYRLQTLEMALEALEDASYCVQNNYLPDKMGHDWDEVIASLRQTINSNKHLKQHMKPVVQFKDDAQFISIEDYEYARVYAMDHPKLGMGPVRTSIIVQKFDDGSFETMNTIYRPLKACLKPAHQWVGLTLEDKQEYVAQDYGGNRLDAMDWAEKRLKEKNSAT